MQETWVRSLGWEDLLEKETATHSSTLAWRIPPTEEPGRLQSMGCKESETTEWLCGVAKSRTRLSDFTFTFSLLWNHKGSLEARRSSFSLGELRKCFTRKITWTTFESRTCETWNSSTQLHSRRTQWMDARRADLTAAGGCRFWATCLALWWTAT